MDFLNASKKVIADFSREEDGAQIVEYGLIIAAVSLGLIAILAQLTGTDFTTFRTNVGTWLRTGAGPTA